MNMNYLEVEDISSPDPKIHRIGIILKALALILVVVSVILLVYGLIPNERIASHRDLGGYSGSSSTIEANKGDIMVIDYEVDGNDVAFYLTYGESWDSGNHDYIEKKDHARFDHFEINVKKSGLYYLNFVNNNPSTSGGFTVDLNYIIMNRYSPLHIIFGVAALVIGLVLTIIYLRFEKRPPILESDSFIRLIIM